MARGTSFLGAAVAIAALGAVIAACGGGGGGGDTTDPAGTGAGASGGSVGAGGASNGGHAGALGLGGMSSACVAGKCPSGMTCCGTVCADTQTDKFHCGDSCTSCPGSVLGQATCVAGACQLMCNGGNADCDGDPNNGCESNLPTDPVNCGKCGSPCTYLNGNVTCVGGVCGSAGCKPGFADCDKDPKNGCETDTYGSPKTCGGCGTPCPAAANATAVCTAGVCTGFTCAKGFADCDGDKTNGCETNIDTDPGNCGGCKKAGDTMSPFVCTAKPNASLGCHDGVCGVGKCSAGFDDCNKSGFDGCEADLTKDVGNCGACGMKCPVPAGGEASCAKSQCNLGGCNPGFGNCDKMASTGCEVNLATDASNCGVCGNACPAVPHGQPGCKFFTCDIASCEVGYADCFGNGKNGCQTNLNSDSNNCGMCGKACPPIAHGTGDCEGASCIVTACIPPYQDCDGDVDNGCESKLDADPNNCGTCHKPCMPGPHATPGCAGNTCTIVACDIGFSNCDGDIANGCERDTTNDPKNCGGCGVVCGTGTCTNSKCVCSTNVLVLDDDDSNGTAALVTALSASYNVTKTTMPSWQYAGVPDLGTFGAVVVLAGTIPSQTNDMPAAGQNAIAAFVNAGNGLVLSEWAASQVSQGHWATLAQFVLLSRTGSTSGQTKYTVDPAFVTHPLWAGLPSEFTFASFTNVGIVNATVNGAVRVAGSDKAIDGVAIRDLPSVGRVVDVSHAGNYLGIGWKDPNIQQLMSNAVGWAARCK